MTTLCLTGWQQQPDALAVIAPDALHLDYSLHDSAEALFASLPPAPERAIGWSLGGQLLVRAIAAGRLMPQKLILLGAPFQGVEDDAFPLAMPRPLFQTFREDYARLPDATLRKFNAIVASGDEHGAGIVRALNAAARRWPNGLAWLDDLGASNCAALGFTHFPPTVIVHGIEDQVVHPAHAKRFAEHLPRHRRILLQGCGHAPHLHGPEKLLRLLEKADV